MTPAQLTLLSEPRARSTDPETSRAAATAITPGRLENLILTEFAVNRHPSRGRDGMTDDELCCLLADLHAPSVKTARSRLSKRGLLTDSGARRLSSRGRPSIVWRLP